MKERLKKICKDVETILDKETEYVNGEDYSFSIMDAYNRITMIDDNDVIIAKIHYDDKEIQVYSEEYVQPLVKFINNRRWEKIIYYNRDPYQIFRLK